MNLPPPTTFGLPDQFTEWREHQSEACESQVDCPTRHLVQVCPTGFGKSVVYMTAAQLLEGRTVVLTSTKGLQSQLLKEFGDMDGVVDIRGRVNYACRLNTRVNCDLGLCVFGVKCRMREEGGCFYFDQLRRARRAKVVITNYAYWMAQNEYSEGIGNFEHLVLDEAHSAPDHLLDHMGVQFSRFNRLEVRMLELDGPLPRDPGAWRNWAEYHNIEVERDMEAAKEHRRTKEFHALKRINGKLNRMETMDRTWVWEDSTNGITLSPIWPAPYSEGNLFLGTPRVTMTSATVVAKTAELLGVTEDVTFEEYPHSFPVANRPLIHLPTVRMNYRNGPAEEKLWLMKVDQIIRDRIGTKGIIHTISYARRDLVLEQSKYSFHMVTHSRKDTELIVRSFQSASEPCILVSPSMATGWDFPHDQCRWQIIVKLPYPDTRGAIIKARMKDDDDFTAYIVMQQLIQATGRGVRAVDDWCETFIIDDNITWFMDKYRKLSVAWFDGAYRSVRTIPKPIGGGQ